MQKTENYNLNLFESTDPVKHEDINTNTELIDTAINGVKEAFAVKHFAVGTYAGNDGTRTVALGFTPRLVLVCNTMAVANIGNKLGMAVTGGTYDTNAVTKGMISIVTNGFKVVNDSGYAMNSSTYSYHYFALG